MNSYWWFRPSRLALFVVLPIACYATAASNQFYQRFGGYNAITGDRFFVVWLTILGFAGASWIGEIIAPEPPSPLPYIRAGNFRVLQYGLALIAGAAMIIFLSPFIAQPTFILNVITGVPDAVFAAQLYANQISGVTSLENLFNLVVVLFVIKPRLTGHPMTTMDKLTLAIILAAMTLKAVIHGERLALIELVLPLSIVLVGTARRSVAWTLAPVAGLVGMFLFFMGTEYLRSWIAYYNNEYDSLLSFAAQRMLGYYMTSINNGAYIYSQTHPFFFPVYSGEWLWHMPIPQLRAMLSALTGTNFNSEEMLSRSLNVEFNNTSGIFAPIIDFGPVLGVAIWVVLGYISGRMYRSFIEQRYTGLILFPTWYVGLLELPRVFYWGDPRFFPTLVVSLAIIFTFAFLLPHKPRGTTDRRQLALTMRAPASDPDKSGAAAT